MYNLSNVSIHFRLGRRERGVAESRVGRPEEEERVEAIRSHGGSVWVSVRSRKTITSIHWRLSFTLS